MAGYVAFVRERGTNENTNQLLREHFPKTSTSLTARLTSTLWPLTRHQITPNPRLPNPSRSLPFCSPSTIVVSTG
jgi:IS30 family transposase